MNYDKIKIGQKISWREDDEGRSLDKWSEGIVVAKYMTSGTRTLGVKSEESNLVAFNYDLYLSKGDVFIEEEY